MALPSPPPLGYPVPDSQHAVSVQLPTWQDMQGMVTQEPRVMDAQQIGYPRSFLNQHVVKVHRACLAVAGDKNENCLLYPSLDHALACREMIIETREGSTDWISAAVKTVGIDFSINHASMTSSGTSKEPQYRRLFATLFPEQYLGVAMSFWRLTGTGISSRLAEALEPHLSSLICAAPLYENDNPTLHRDLLDTKANTIISRRIANLVKRASVNSSHSLPVADSDVYLYPSGMAAIYECNKLLQRWRPGPSIVFGFPYELTLKLLQTYGQSCKFYGFGTPEELDDLEAYIIEERLEGRSIQSVWCECASNPLLRTVDLSRIRQLANEFKFLLIVDETIGSFANVDVTDVADIFVTSLTKSFSGNADVMGGSIVVNPKSPYYQELTASLGSIYRNELFADDAVVLEYNSRKFLPRAATMNKNAVYLVSLLQRYTMTKSSTLRHVYYPLTCWSLENYQARMRKPTLDFIPGYGGLFTLEFESVTAASTFFNNVNVHKGPSLGASLTLAQPYVQTVFSKQKEWAASYGLDETIVRISIGLENEVALGREFKRALRLADRFKAGREYRQTLESFL